MANPPCYLARLRVQLLAVDVSPTARAAATPGGGSKLCCNSEMGAFDREIAGFVLCCRRCDWLVYGPGSGVLHLGWMGLDPKEFHGP
jgi:hypothetical protein